jgi:hypothetical protein
MDATHVPSVRRRRFLASPALCAAKLVTQPELRERISARSPFIGSRER